MQKISAVKINNYKFLPEIQHAGNKDCATNCINKENANFKKIPLEVYKAHSLSFLGKPKEIITPDMLHQKIKKESMNIELKDVKTMVKNVETTLKAEGVEVYEDDILETMYALTQFANMDGIKKLNKKVSKQTTGEYFPGYSVPIGLGNTMHYLTKKGIIENENTGHRRVVGLDDISFKQLEKSFQVPYIRACFDHYEFFYPIGWSEGINIFNQEKDYKKFEKSVVELIKKADEKGGYFKNTLREILEENVKKQAEKLEIEPEDIIFVDTLEYGQEIDYEDIKNNLNTKIPQKEDIEALCKGLGEYVSQLTGKDKDFCTNLIAKYFYDNLIFYSPKHLTEKMKEIYTKIEEALPEGKTMDDVLYIIPQTGKSYDYINYQYASVNNIDPEKFIEKNGPMAELENSGKVLVYIDDISASGDSTLEQMGGLCYDLCDDWRSVENKNRNTFIICTLYATERAIERTEKKIRDRNKRECLENVGKDKLIIIDKEKEEVKYSEEEKEVLKKIKKEILDIRTGAGGYRGVETKIIFPYMTPDSNAPVFKFLSEKLVDKSAIKTQISPINVEHDVKKLIKKNNKSDN